MPVVTLVAVTLAVLAGTPLATRQLRRAQVLDHPTSRSSHDSPTPRGGGVVLVVGLAVSASFMTAELTVRATLAVASLAFGTLGFLEDLSGVSVRRRLLSQALLAGGAVAALSQVLSMPALFILISVAWIIGFVNIFNFMDGIDGIATGQAIVAGVAWLSLGVTAGDDVAKALGGITVAAALGFLPSNFPRARVFLGDGGSYGVSAWLSIAAVVLTVRGLGAPAVLAPFALFVYDAAVVILRRLLRGEAIHLPHRSHVYQQLALRWGHPRTTVLACGLMAVLSALGRIASGRSSPAAVAGAAGAAVLILWLYGRLPRWASEERLARMDVDRQAQKGVAE